MINRQDKRGETVVIYGEYLFLENFITGGLLLYLTGAICGCSVQGIRWVRLLSASSFLGLCGFLMFFPAPWPVTAVMRIGTGIMATGIFMGRPGIVKKSVVFICLTFLSGGAVMAFMLWRQQPALAKGGLLYMSPFTYVTLIMWGSGAFALTWAFVRTVKLVRIRSAAKGKARVVIEGRELWFEAMADTGNSLREPLTGRPVMVLDNKGSGRFRRAFGGVESLPDKRYAMVPFKAVGAENGLLEAVRSDRVIFDGKVSEGAVIAFYDGDFGEFEMLLNMEVFDEKIV